MAVTLAREAPERILPQPPTNIPSASVVALDCLRHYEHPGSKHNAGVLWDTWLTCAIYLNFLLPVSQSKAALL